MTHRHTKLISEWLVDNNTKFEFAYGTGVDFIWSDCDIHYVIDNPSMQIRTKEKERQKQKKYVAIEVATGQTTKAYSSRSECFDDWFSGCMANTQGWEIVEVEL